LPLRTGSIATVKMQNGPALIGLEQGPRSSSTRDVARAANLAQVKRSSLTNPQLAICSCQSSAANPQLAGS